MSENLIFVQGSWFEDKLSRLLGSVFSSNMQPSRSSDDSDKFFGCRAYLTVSGQLQAEALARYCICNTLVLEVS